MSTLALEGLIEICQDGGSTFLRNDWSTDDTVWYKNPKDLCMERTYFQSCYRTIKKETKGLYSV